MDLEPTEWHERLFMQVTRPTSAATGENLSAAVIEVSCRLGPFRVVATRPLHSPADGPESLALEGIWEAGDGDDLVGPWTGVTTEVLRAIPMQAIRRRLADLAQRALRDEGSVPDVPLRADTEADLARFAATYADLVDAGHTKPLQRLSELSGISRNTLSARIRRAREQGILTPYAPGSLGRLTDKGRTLMNDGRA